MAIPRYHAHHCEDFACGNFQIITLSLRGAKRRGNLHEYMISLWLGDPHVTSFLRMTFGALREVKSRGNLLSCHFFTTKNNPEGLFYTYYEIDPVSTTISLSKITGSNNVKNNTNATVIATAIKVVISLFFASSRFD